MPSPVSHIKEREFYPLGSKFSVLDIIRHGKILYVTEIKIMIETLQFWQKPFCLVLKTFRSYILAFLMIFFIGKEPGYVIGPVNRTSETKHNQYSNEVLRMFLWRKNIPCEIKRPCQGISNWDFSRRQNLTELLYKHEWMWCGENVVNLWNVIKCMW